MTDTIESLRAEIESLREEIKRLKDDRRERIARAVMASMGATSAFDDYVQAIKWSSENPVTAAKFHAELAVEWADALIAELDKEPSR